MSANIKPIKNSVILAYDCEIKWCLNISYPKKRINTILYFAAIIPNMMCQNEFQLSENSSLIIYLYTIYIRQSVATTLLRLHSAATRP